MNFSLADFANSATLESGMISNFPLSGVSLIIGGIDADGNSKLYLTDPSGTYIEYDAIAIGSDSNQVMKFLEEIIIQILHQMMQQ